MRAQRSGGMCQNTAWIIFEFVPLLHKIIAAVVADLVDDPAVGIANLSYVWRIDDDLASIRHSWFHLVHAFGRCPQVIIHLRHNREHTLVGPVNVNNVFSCRNARDLRTVSRTSSSVRYRSVKPCPITIFLYSINGREPAIYLGAVPITELAAGETSHKTVPSRSWGIRIVPWVRGR